MATLEEVAVGLYAVTPAEFTPSRGAAVRDARAASDRDLAQAIGRLPRPTVAAWAVNVLVREHPDEVGELLTLGSRLVEAQVARAGPELRELDRQRHRTMAALVTLAAGLAADAGQRLTNAVAVQVESTLRAAMSDPDAARAVLTGLLTTGLTSTGFEAVDVTGALAVPGARPLPDAPVRPTPMRLVPPDRSVEEQDTRVQGTPERRAAEQRPEPQRADKARVEQARVEQARAEQAEAKRQEVRRRKRADAENDAELADREAAEASAALDQAVADADDLAAEQEEITTAIRDLAQQVKALTAELHRLRSLEPAAAKDARNARTHAEVVRRTADSAQRRADAARKHLAALPRDL